MACRYRHVGFAAAIVVALILEVLLLAGCGTATSERRASTYAHGVSFEPPAADRALVEAERPGRASNGACGGAGQAAGAQDAQDAQDIESLDSLADDDEKAKPAEETGQDEGGAEPAGEEMRGEDAAGEAAGETAAPSDEADEAEADEPASSVRSPAEAIAELKLMRERDQATSKELFLQARKKRALGELDEAEALLERALGSWSQNQEARAELDEVRFLLGDRRGEPRSIAGQRREEKKMLQEQAKVEVQRLIYLGMQHEQDENYDQAIESYKRAIDIARSWPLWIPLDDEVKAAENRLRDAEDRRKTKEVDDRAKLRRLIEEQKSAEAEESWEYLKNNINALHRNADRAMKDKQYGKAAALYEQILELNRFDDGARRNLVLARRRDHVQSIDRVQRELTRNYELAILGVEESAIVYQQIFRYGDKDEWLRISKNVVSVEEQIQRGESPLDKEIRRKLSSPYPSFGVPEETPLKQVLAELQTLTSVNFFIVAGEGANPGDTPIKLDTLSNLPLKNILAFILKQAGEDVGYIVREGAVVVGPKASLDEPKYLRFYAIGDLTHPRPDFPAPDLALEEQAGRADTGGGAVIDIGAGPDESQQPDKEDLMRLIAREIGGAEAADADAELEDVEIYGDKLIALTTLENHLKLAKILDRFRRSTGMMVTVESRFLDVQDNFLEEIGVNFGGTGTSNLPNSIPDIDGAGTALSPGYEFIDAKGNFNFRGAVLGGLSNPLGSQVNPFQLSSSGGAAYQLNLIDAERFQLEAILTAVGKEQEIRRLNSPRVTAYSAQKSHTLVVNQAAYIQDLEVNQTGVIPVINPVIGVLNTGSILEVRPTVSYDRKYVVLEIQPTLAEQIGQDEAVLNLSGNFTVVPVQLPIVSVTKIKTTINVPDGGTVLLGGLKREIQTDASIGIPGLRRIPILNLVFGRRGNATLRSNLFVLINAKITIVHEEEARLFGTGSGV
jgi:hypothetical protein